VAVAHQFIGLQMKATTLGTIHTHPLEETEADRELVRKYFEPATEHAAEEVPLEEVMGTAAAQALREPNTGFYEIHKFVSDPAYPNRSLVYRLDNDEFIGYMVDGSFVPLAEAPALGLATQRDPVAERREMEEQAKRPQQIIDPVQATIDGGGVSRNDSLLVVKLDWNEDGADDFLIASDSDRQLASFGDLTWTVFLSNSAGAYDIDPSGLSAPAEGLRIDRREEFGGKLGFITYGPRGEQTPIYGQYLENGRIETKELAVLRRDWKAQSDQEAKAIAAQNEAEFARYVSPTKTLQYQPVPVADRWPVSGPAREPPLPLAEDPAYRYNLAVDPLDDGRFLAYDKASGELAGYLIQNQFVPLQAAAAQGLPTKRDVVAERREIEAKQHAEPK
jgi:hypothetical protein